MECENEVTTDPDILGLGMEKMVSLFVILFIGIMLSITTFTSETIVRECRNVMDLYFGNKSEKTEKLRTRPWIWNSQLESFNTEMRGLQDKVKDLKISLKENGKMTKGILISEVNKHVSKWPGRGLIRRSST